jgi:glutathione S-transferase
MDLYYLPTCPHCHKVISWIEARDLTGSFNFIDVTASDAAGLALEEATGQDGVPALVTKDGEAIIGDAPILEYLSSVFE